MTSFINIYTVVSTSALRNSLFKHCFPNILAVTGLVLAGTLLPIDHLERWGWLIFLICFAVILKGLFSYKKLMLLQLKPDQLVLEPDCIQYLSKNKPIMVIPKQVIKNITFLSSSTYYGVLIALKQPTIHPIKVHASANKSLVKQMRQEGKKEKADIFFAYFNQKACDKLNDWHKKS